jgi:hypothetical protein
MLVIAFGIMTAGALAPADGIAGKGGGVIQDSCAASFAPESAEACGGSWPQMTQCWSINRGSYWEGFFGYDGGPGSSPRYWTSWWTASYNLCG